MKYASIRVFSDSYSPICGHSRRFCPYTRQYRSVKTQKSRNILKNHSVLTLIWEAILRNTENNCLLFRIQVLIKIFIDYYFFWIACSILINCVINCFNTYFQHIFQDVYIRRFLIYNSLVFLGIR